MSGYSPTQHVRQIVASEAHLQLEGQLNPEIFPGVLRRQLQFNLLPRSRRKGDQHVQAEFVPFAAGEKGGEKGAWPLFSSFAWEMQPSRPRGGDELELFHVLNI